MDKTKFLKTFLVVAAIVLIWNISEARAGVVKIWNTHSSDWDCMVYKFTSSKAWLNKTAWTQIPYNTYTYDRGHYHCPSAADRCQPTHFACTPGADNNNAANAIVVETAQFYLFFHANNLDSPFMYAKILDASNNIVPGSNGEMYIKTTLTAPPYPPGTAHDDQIWNFKINSLTITKNTPEEVVITIDGGRVSGINIVQYTVKADSYYTEATPTTNYKFSGGYHGAPNRFALSPVKNGTGDDFVVDKKNYKHLPLGLVSPNEPRVYHDVGPQYENMMIGQISGGQYAYMTMYDDNAFADPRIQVYRRGEDEQLSLASMISYAQKGTTNPRFIFATTTKKNTFVGESTYEDALETPSTPSPGKYISKGAYYTLANKASVAGIWRVSARYKTVPALPLTASVESLTAEAKAEPVYTSSFTVHPGAPTTITFQSPVAGTLEALALYLYDRTSETPADVKTLMDIYRAVRGQVTPPAVPAQPIGPAAGNTGTAYTYTTSAVDPDGDQVKYTFDWGDGTTNVTGLVNSGVSAGLAHSWTTAGTYLVKAKATDSKGADSASWSTALSVTISVTPGITVIAPNGGESFAGNTQQTVTWTSEGAVGSVNIDLSIDGGSTWSALIANTANDGTQAVTIPNTPSALCKVRVQEPDGVPADISNSGFTITPASAANGISNPGFESGTASWSYSAGGGGTFTASPPGYEGANAGKCAITAANATIQLYQPGIVLEPDTRYRLTFSAYSTAGHDVRVDMLKHGTPYTSYGLSYTANLGTAWQTFTTEFNTAGFTGQVSDGRFRFWFGPFAAAGDVYYLDNVRLELVSASPPAITVTAPNGGESFAGNTQQTVTWTSAGAVGSVNIDLSIDGGFTWSALIANTANDGTQAVTIPNTPSALCKVRVQEPDGSPSDVSNANFTIVPEPAIVVTAPNGGESMTGFTLQTITWTSAGAVGNVDVEISTNSGSTWRMILANTANDGNQLMFVPNTPSAACRIRVQEPDGSPSDVSDSNFMIIRAPEITLIAPNGGESLTGNTQQLVTWTSAGAVGNVMISLTTNAGRTWTTLVAETANDGSEAVTILNTPSPTCRIRVQELDGSPASMSSGEFTIVPEPAIVVTAPNGGESFVGNTSQTVTWTNAGAVGSVNIDLSIDGGSTWSALIANTTNDGTQAVTIPNTPSALCKVRVQEPDGSPSGVSNASFTIVPEPAIVVTAPNGGESFVGNTSQTVTWTSVGAVGSVNIDLSIDGGSTWSALVSNTANDGSQAVTIPNTPSATCRIRVKEPDGSPTDMSNSNFTITPASAANGISNPGFESGTASWSYSAGGGGTFTASPPGYEGANAGKCAITAANATIQLYQPGIVLEPNTRYRLTFSAYSTAGHDVRVDMLKHGTPYTSYGLSYTANLGTAWQTFTTEFNTAGFTGQVSDGRFRFWFGPFAAAGDVYYVDKITLQKVALASVTAVSSLGRAATVIAATLPASNRRAIKVVGYGVVIAGDESMQPGDELEITINYESSEVKGCDENQFVVGMYNENDLRWQVLPTLKYPADNKVVAKCKVLGRFGLLELLTVADGLDNVSVYPNPYNPRRHVQGLTIDGLTPSATIKIYTIVGKLVREINESDGDGRVIWDGRNEGGKEVASGVYIGYIKGATGTKKVKIAVEK